MKSIVACVLLGLVAVHADVYIHGCIRGSNNRNCRNDNNDRRRNANRLFDSQNNNKGGYSCPRAYPFPAGSANKGTVDQFGHITGTDVIDTPVYTIFGGSVVNMEWTNQHGGGSNPNLHTDIVWQYMTNNTNTYIRDGTPITNDDADNSNDEATGTITAATVNDGRFGYHETLASYQTCRTTVRNVGLFVADQNLQGKNARFTRQNPNGETFGFECAEERDYYPYWRPTAWHDVAIFTKNVTRCQSLLSPQSQNIVSKCQCISTTATEANPAPIVQRDCEQAGGVWNCSDPWNAQKLCGYNGQTWSCDTEPSCMQSPYSRDNHLGNQVPEEGITTSPDDTSVKPSTFKWTVPEFLETTKVVLRIRYNVSTYDFDMDTTDSLLNGAKSPVIDRTNREELSYIDVGLTPTGATNPTVYNLGLAVNTDQYARTFQDRTYVFIVKPLPTQYSTCRGRLFNIGMRGKRGNIVQVYPSVEYDFSPQQLTVSQDDCVHIQWIGSDYNPNRNPNDAEGGPPNPNNSNEAKADRTNLVQMLSPGRNRPMSAVNLTDQNCLFWKDGKCDIDMYRRLAYIDQDMSTCRNVTQLKAAGVNNREQRERDARNCGKLSAATTPYFNAGIQQIKSKTGNFYFYSTRNNNFSNRSQKLKVSVKGGSDSSNSGSALTPGQGAGIAVGVLAGVGAVGLGAVALYRKKTPNILSRYRVAARKPQV
eukprot:c17491_g1_i1.p1 GENE.c17491_g1_i1~~c17491_g1_i1.p1  ORF type:complete len:706 (+),score=190.27 c17491_g1_i1:157-2274(+)